MCPFCWATLGLVAAGAATTSGIAALAVKVSRRIHGVTEIISNSNERRNQDVNEQHGESEISFTR